MTNDLTGRIIRGYEILEQIGAGGFGAVYRASQPVLKREVAIKVVLPEYANSPDFVRRFEIEAEVVARLEHPYIVPLFDYWREPDSAFLVLRLLRGGTLQNLLEKKEPLPLEQIATILDQITSALHVSHRNNVVHRDIKPANILLDEDGNAYLTDFGIAQTTDYESISGDEGITGSISHTPPEQIQSGKITPQTDIYALGIILYQMLAGEHPFAESTVSQMVFKHLSDPIPDLDRDDIAYDINDILQKATAKDPQDRYEDVRELATEFRSLLLGEIVFEQPQDDQLVLLDVDNPYKGLRAFQEADADQFFGRTNLVERLLDRMAETTRDARFLAVIGPSGSGKSSVVKAGLLPAIRQGRLRNSDNWFIVEMFPGLSPFTELRSALMRVAVNPVQSLINQIENEKGLSDVINQILPDDGSELVLVIDQFEELFTQVEDEAIRTRFLDNLVDSVQADNSRLRVIVTMRADFYDKPLQYREFGELLRKRIETVLPMSSNELFETITHPAERVGAGFQPGLVEAISQDVGQQAGMLPLLQYTMTELFDNRQGQTLTLAAYQDIGGVTGSLARRSEELFLGLDQAGQLATRQLFLRLVSLGEGTEDTRRRVRQSELATTDAIDKVIKLYGQYRLLTFDKDPNSREPTVEVAHEALIRTWERLQQWIDESREDLRVQRRVSSAVNEWISSGRDDSFLASGARLTQFQEWRNQTQLILNADENTYIATSIQAEEARKQKELAIARRVQNFQRASIVLGLMVALAIVATGIFLNRATTAQNQANQALSTLEPAQSAVFDAQNLANDAETQVAVAGTQAEQAEQAVIIAQQQATSAQNDLDIAQTQIGNAETQGAVVSQLTRIAPTIASADERVSALELQVENVGMTLTPAQAAIDAAQVQVVAAQSTVAIVQTEVGEAQLEAEIAQTNVAVSQNDVSTAQADAAVAQADVIIAQTDVALAQEDVIAAQSLALAAQAEAQVAQTDVGIALDEAQTAQSDAGLAQADANLAQTQVASSGETLTPVAATVIAGAQQLAQQQSDLSTAQVLAGNAETQVAVVSALTQVAPTIAAADERVANLERTLTPVQSTIDAAQRQIDNVGLTLTPIQDQIVQSQNQAATAQAQANIVQRAADSIFLAVNAEQALDLGNYDLALALTFESLNLDANQTRARRILNEVAFGTARLSFNDTQVGQLSPDSNYFVVSDGNDLIVWDVASRAVIDRLVGHTAPILSVDFTTDMTRIVTGSADTTARLWDITGWRSGNTASQTVVLSDHTGAINVVRFGFNPSLPTVFTGSDDSNIIEWSISNGSIVRQYTGNTWAVSDLTFVGDGNNFFTTVDANGTPILLYWNVGNVNPSFTEQSLIFDRFNNDATRAVVGGNNGRALEVYNTTRRSSVRQFTRNINWSTETATAFGFSPTGGLGLMALSSAQGEDRLVLVDIATGEIVQTFVGQATQGIDAIAYNPSGNLVLTASDNILTLWDVQSGTVLRTLAAHTDVITAINWSDDGRFASSVSRDNNIRLWDITGADEALRQIITIETAINRGKFPGFNSRGDRVIAGVWVSLFNWDAQTGMRNESVSTGDEIINVIYSPSESRAITVLENVAFLWDIDAGANGRVRSYGDEVAQFTGQAAYSLNGAFIALDDATRILIYEIATGSRQTINKPRFDDNQVVTSLAVSPDGRYVVTSIGQRFQQEASAGAIIMWDTATGQALYNFPVGHNRTINWVAFSADGNRVLSASDDDTLIVWSVTPQAAAVTRRFAGHIADVNIGRFVPNAGNPERFILSASDDRTMILWDIDSAQPLRTFRGSPAAITGLNISPDGTQMVTSYGLLEQSQAEPIDGSPETLIYVWELTDTDDLIIWTANNRFIRPLTAAECDQYGITNCESELAIPNTNSAVPTSNAVSDNDVAPTPILPPNVATANSNQALPATSVPATQSVVSADAPFAINAGSQGLNVRASDTTNATIVTILQANEQATIIGRSNRDTRWYQIRLEGNLIGWVRGDLVTISGDLTTLPNVSPPPIVQPAQATSSGVAATTAPSVTTVASSQANLQITGLGLVPSPPQCLQTFTVQLNITNTGTESTSAEATVFVFDRHVASGTRSAQGSVALPILTPNQNWVVSVDLNVSTFFAENHEIVAQVDSNGAVAESNEGDNFFTSIYTLGSGSC
ncbi:MAG: protein kinase [Phototrophicaceae bacterium]